MTIHYTLFDQGTLVYARAFGTFTLEALIEHERKVLQDARITRDYRQLLDCRWVTDDLVDGRASAALTDLHAQVHHRRRSVRCAVVTQNVRWFQVEGCYGGDTYGLTLIAFNDPRTACIWLGTECGPETLPGWSDLMLMKTMCCVPKGP